ncbi:hypothetical protein BUB20358_00250 [Burkholderia ubonensis]|nr:hypothetical protein BUB20358_00250 [Burkholderia ubonensis]
MLTHAADHARFHRQRTVPGQPLDAGRQQQVRSVRFERFERGGQHGLQAVIETPRRGRVAGRLGRAAEREVGADRIAGAPQPGDAAERRRIVVAERGNAPVEQGPVHRDRLRIGRRRDRGRGRAGGERLGSGERMRGPRAVGAGRAAHADHRVAAFGRLGRRFEPVGRVVGQAQHLLEAQPAQHDAGRPAEPAQAGLDRQPEITARRVHAVAADHVRPRRAVEFRIDAHLGACGRRGAGGCRPGRARCRACCRACRHACRRVGRHRHRRPRRPARLARPRADRRQPVRLALEAVMRQVVERRGAFMRVRAPVDGEPGLARLREDRGKAVMVGIDERRQPLHRARRRGGLRHAREDRLGTDLDHQIDVLREQAAHRLLETHGLPDVIGPVAGVERPGVHVPRQVRDQRRARRGVLDAFGDRAEAAQDRLHQRRVERALHREREHRDLPLAGQLHEGVELLRVARHHLVARPVERGHGQPVEAAQQRLDLGERREQRDHRAARGALVHQLAAPAQQADRGGLAHHARITGRAEFADAVAEHHARLDAGLAQQQREAVLDAEQRHLRVARLVDARARLAPHHVEQVEPGLFAHQRRAAFEMRAEHRARLREPARHAVILRALARVHERDPQARARRVGRRAAVCRRRRRCRREAFTQRVVRIERERDAPRMLRAAGRQRARQRGEIEPLAARVDVPGERREVRAQRGGRRGRDDGGQRRRRPRPGGGAGLGRNEFLDDQVRVAAAEAERADARAARPTGRCLPFSGLPRDLDAPFVELEQRAHRIDVQVRGHHAMLHREHHLDEARHARHGLGVPEVGLDRADRQRRGALDAGAVRVVQRLDLDRIAEPRAGAVRLHVVDVGGCAAGQRERAPDHVHLRLPVRRGQAVGAPVLHQRGGLDHRMDAVAVGERVGQPLEQQHDAALAAHVAVGARVEGLAEPVGRQHAGAAVGDAQRRPDHHVDRRGHRHRGAAVEQAAAGREDRAARRRAGGVDRHRRSAEIEAVREPSGRRRQRGARAEPRVDLAERAFAQRQRLVVVRVRAEEHADVAPGLRVRIDAGLLERLVHEFEQQPLLRIERLRLARRDAEERGVEAVDVGQEAALVDLRQRRRQRGQLVAVFAPARVGARADHAAALVEHAPVSLRRIDAARKTQRDADDRDVGVACAARRDRGNRAARRGRAARRRRRPRAGFHRPKPRVDMAGDRARGRIGEERCRIELDRERRAEQQAQLHQPHRIEAQLAQRPIGREGVGRAHDAPDRFGHHVERAALAARLAGGGRRLRRARAEPRRQVVADQHAVAAVVDVLGARARHHAFDRRAMQVVKTQQRVDRLAVRVAQADIARHRFRLRNERQAARDAVDGFDAGRQRGEVERVFEELIAERERLEIGMHADRDQLPVAAVGDVRVGIVGVPDAQHRIEIVDALRIEHAGNLPAVFDHELPVGERAMAPLERGARQPQRLGPAARVDLQQGRDVVRRHRADRERFRVDALQDDARERRDGRVAAQRIAVRIEPRARERLVERAGIDERLAGQRVIEVEAEALGLAEILAREPHRQREHLEHDQPVAAHDAGPASQMLAQVARDARRRQPVAARVDVHVIVAARLRRVGGLGRQVERAVVIEERAHVQDRVGIVDAVLAQHVEQRPRLADVGVHQQVRQPVERAAGGVERALVVVGTDQQQRMPVETTAARRARRDRRVQMPQQRAVAATHVDDMARLRVDRLAVEQLDHEIGEIAEILAVLEAAADHVEGAVDVGLVPVGVARQHAARVAADQFGQCRQQRPVRSGHAHRQRALAQMPPAFVQRERSRRRSRCKQLLRVEPVAQHRMQRRMHARREVRAVIAVTSGAAFGQREQQRHRQRAVEQARPVGVAGVPAARRARQPRRELRRLRAVAQTGVEVDPVKRVDAVGQRRQRTKPIRRRVGFLIVRRDAIERVQRAKREAQVAGVRAQRAAEPRHADGAGFERGEDAEFATRRQQRDGGKAVQVGVDEFQHVMRPGSAPHRTARRHPRRHRRSAAPAPRGFR